MDKERGKNNNKAAKRRLKTYSLKLNSPSPRPELRIRWIFIVGGVLILTIVAFLSGLRLGKGLQELKSGIQASSAKINKTIEKEKKDLPFIPQPQPSPPTTVAEPKTKPSPPKAKYTLQVAALNNAEEAKQMVLRLQNKGYPAYQITGSGAAKGTLYRVRVGRFTSLQEAKEFALNFEKKEKIKPLIKPIEEEH